jgi:hypothetical protein
MVALELLLAEKVEAVEVEQELLEVRVLLVQDFLELEAMV